MVVALVTTAIAVAGTLLGSIVSGRAQQRAAEQAARAQGRAAERTAEIAHRQELRRERLGAIRDVAGALTDHRIAMWDRGQAVLNGAPSERVQELRDASHTTRRAVTGPLTALRVLIEDEEVRAAADRMVTLTYALRDTYRIDGPTAPETREAAKTALTAARAAAVDAHDEFVDIAGRYLRTT
ncbi:hypothetical protein [Streptomyces violaceusniger]|uniref:hypothetical protein n=1 Tax=Streptomyces violaceusniger TaxID=68280 RepID=UPI0037FD2CC6